MVMVECLGYVAVSIPGQKVTQYTRTNDGAKVCPKSVHKRPPLSSKRLLSLPLDASKINAQT
jgi:hypothetical protein